MWNKQKKAAARERLKAVENDPAVSPGVARAAPVVTAGEWGRISDGAVTEA
jgi:hypothetical protein